MNIREKLLKTDRTINKYDNQNLLVEEIMLDITLEELLQIVTPNNDDPDIYDGYVLNNEQIYKLNKFTKIQIIPNCELFFYVLEATGIYDWGKRNDY